MHNALHFYERKIFRYFNIYATNSRHLKYLFIKYWRFKI